MAHTGAGRRPQPAALKLLKGRTFDTDSGGRPVAEGPAFARSAPEPPGWLDTEAKAEWRRIVPELTRLRLLRTIDRATLAAYCTAWSHYVDCVEVYAQGRCSASVMKIAATELRQWAREFGLTPSSEGGLTPPELPDAGDPFAG